MRYTAAGWVGAACVGLGSYLILRLSTPDAPAPAPAGPPPAAAVDPAPVPAAVLAHVVELTDLDPLLDPPAKPDTGAPFDADPAVVPASGPAPAVIPPAAEDPAEEVAPMPLGVADPGRAVWYGEHRVPRQLSIPARAGRLPDVIDFHERRPPGGVAAGAGYFI
jgi:hypothetical protein